MLATLWAGAACQARLPAATTDLPTADQADHEARRAQARLLAEVARPIDADGLRTRLSELPPDRSLLSPGHAAARRWILESLAALRLSAAALPFHSAREPRADLANLELRWPGETDASPILIVSAHYDSVPLTPGADDNGSGTCVLLELARRLARESFRSELRLVWFDAEEPGLIGSAVYVQGLTADEARRVRLLGLINLETIGYTDRRPGSQQMPPGSRLLFDPGDRGDFLLVLGNVASGGLAAAVQKALLPERGESFRPLMFSLVPDAGWLLPDSRRSDHAPFWDAGLPAVMLTDTANLRSPHYHSPGDTLETLDLPFLVAAARGVERAVRELAQAR